MLEILLEFITVLDHYGFKGLNLLLETIHRCKGFHSIITARPSCILPKQVAKFYYTMETEDKDPTTATFCLPIQGSLICRF